MFDFIKNLFKKDVTEDSVHLDDLNSYFITLKNKHLEPLKQNIEQFYADLRVKLKELEQKFPALEAAAIGKEDESQPARVKNIVEGHKKQYLKLTKILVDRIEIPDSAEDISSFLLELEKELDDYSRSSFKSYRASQHLFFKPVEDIARSLKDIADLISLIKKQCSKHNLIELNSLQKEIQNLFDSIDKKRTLQQQLEEKQNHIDSVKEQIEKKQEEFSAIEKSRDFINFSELNTRRQKLNSQLRAIESYIIDKFAALERPLRKYSKIALDAKIVNSYLTNPVITLIKDQDRKYIEMFSALKNSLIRLGLKNADKVSEYIDDLLDSDALEKLQQNYRAIIEQIAEADKKLQTYEILEKFSNTKKQLENLHFDLEHKEKAFKEHLEILESSDLDTLKHNIEENFLKVFNIKLNIR